MSAIHPQRQFLFSRTVGDLVNDSPTFNIVAVKEGDSIAHVIETLAKNNISSAPVESASQGHKFIGSIDVIDLVWFTCCKMNLKEAEVYTTKKQAEQFQKPLDSALLDISGRNRMRRISYAEPLINIIKMLSDPNTHRVYVMNEVGDYVGLVTQSSLLHYLIKNNGVFGSLLVSPVTNLFTRPQMVHSISMMDSVINALEKIVDYNISGVAVVDEKGALVGNVSASDIKKMQLTPPIQLTYDLFEPINLFCNILTDKDRQLPGQERTKLQLPQFTPQFVYENDNLKKVLSILEEKRIHHVYVVDEQQTPLRVISLCDIFSLLC